MTDLSAVLGRRWTAVPNDAVGGWAVTANGRSPADGGVIAADLTWSRQVAEHIADLHNRALRQAAPHPWDIRAAATGGGPCERCGKPFYTHVCLTCSPDYQTPGPGCHNCRNTGMDQTPCLPPTIQNGARR